MIWDRHRVYAVGINKFIGFWLQKDARKKNTRQDKGGRDKRRRRQRQRQPTATKTKTKT
jgi:hypothetical protein